MRQRVLLTVLVVLVGTAACIGYIIDAAPIRPRPKNYRAAVMRVLDTQRVDYRDVDVIDGCAPSYQLCRFYAGNVLIRATTTMSGQIDCRERWITCSITIPQAGIRGAALDDTIDPLAARWGELYGQLLLWLRSASHGFAQPE